MSHDTGAAAEYENPFGPPARIGRVGGSSANSMNIDIDFASRVWDAFMEIPSEALWSAVGFAAHKAWAAIRKPKGEEAEEAREAGEAAKRRVVIDHPDLTLRRLRVESVTFDNHGSAEVWLEYPTGRSFNVVVTNSDGKLIAAILSRTIRNS